MSPPPPRNARNAHARLSPAPLARMIQLLEQRGKTRERTESRLWRIGGGGGNAAECASNVEVKHFLQIVSDRWNLEMGSKIFICENVTTGSVHELCSKTLSAGGACSIRCIHTMPSDTGHGAVRRFRGWNWTQLTESHCSSQTA